MVKEAEKMKNIKCVLLNFDWATIWRLWYIFGFVWSDRTHFDASLNHQQLVGCISHLITNRLFWHILISLAMFWIVISMDVPNVIHWRVNKFTICSIIRWNNMLGFLLFVNLVIVFLEVISIHLWFKTSLGDNVQPAFLGRETIELMLQRLRFMSFLYQLYVIYYLLVFSKMFI